MEERQWARRGVSRPPGSPHRRSLGGFDGASFVGRTDGPHLQPRPPPHPGEAWGETEVPSLITWLVFLAARPPSS